MAILQKSDPGLLGLFLERGLLLRPLGNVLYFMPPYVVSNAQIDWVFDQIEEVASITGL